MSKEFNKRPKFSSRVNDNQTIDGFNNFTAKLGLQTDNLSSKGQYTLGNLISRNHVQLEAIYRSSWIAGQVVDTVAEDMTKEGISMYSEMSPDHVKTLQSKITELAVWKSICSNIKWSRLYGGSIAVILTEGANYETPLDVSKIGKNSFKGLVVFDRWQVDPSYGDLITELCPEIGMPRYYTILPAMETMSAQKVHYTRCIRLDGIEMPYYQKKIDNLWGMSVIERLYDRLLAFDSATTGAAQLMYKSYLRVVQIKGLRAALAAGGKTEQAVIKQFQYIRNMQTMEGITLLDSEDQFSTHDYSFGGVADVLIQFGQQISGACNIPLVRLFGQSPSGFSTGDTDLRNYYDNINKNQEAKLRAPIYKILDVMSMSEFGEPLPDDFEFEFNSLWEMSEKEKADIAAVDSNTISSQLNTGSITKKIAMKELAQQSRITGRFTNISEDDIKNAEEEIPEHQGMEGEQTMGQEPKLNMEEFKKKLTEANKQKNIEQAEPETDEIEDPNDLDKLERELQALDKNILEKLEKDLSTLKIKREELNQLGLSNTSIEMLENELKKLNSSVSIEALEEQLKSLPTKEVPAKMPVKSITDKVIDAIKRFFK